MECLRNFTSALLILFLLPSHGYAGTGTGCSGDQWSNYHYRTDHIEEVRFVYRTNNLWEIGNDGDRKAGCGTVSKRSNSKTAIKMNNKICAFAFDTKTAKLTVRSMPYKTCSCAGKFKLHQTCSEGQL